MFWWFLIVAVAAGAVVWAGLSAYIQVRKRLKRANNSPLKAEPEAGGTIRPEER
jgi:amino acid permease